MVRLLLPAGLALLAANSVLAAGAKCSLSQKCPKEAPCCGQYGDCGVGAFCLGGCDPRMSFSLDSCAPAPVCQDRKMTFKNLDRIKSTDVYLGDSSQADWYSQGKPLVHNDQLYLTMQAGSVGTVLGSTVTMWYGSVKAKMKTSRGAGVVTAFILMSDVKDEIDYEWVGTQLTTAQTNYYFQGIPNYDNSANITLPQSSFDNFYEYEIRWTPDQIQWLVNGQVGRTKLRKDTWNATASQWNFPQTPSRVQLSLWPGGADTNAPGTVQWAGGPIKWDTEDILKYGYYYAVVDSVEISCYNPKPGEPGSHSKKSYMFKDAKATNDTVVETDRSTVLKSLAGTGLDMDADLPSGALPSGVAAVPGGSSGGPGTSIGGGVNGGSGTGANGANSSNCDPTSFSQTCGGAKSDGVRQERFLGASAFAVVVAVAALFCL